MPIILDKRQISILTFLKAKSLLMLTLILVMLQMIALLILVCPLTIHQIMIMQVMEVGERTQLRLALIYTITDSTTGAGVATVGTDLTIGVMVDTDGTTGVTVVMDTDGTDGIDGTTGAMVVMDGTTGVMVASDTQAFGTLIMVMVTDTIIVAMAIEATAMLTTQVDVVTTIIEIPYHEIIPLHR